MKWFHNLKLARKLMVSFVAVLALAAGIGWFAMYEMNAVNTRLETVTRTDVPGIVAINTIYGATSDIRMREFRYVMARDQSTRDMLRQEMTKLESDRDHAMRRFEALITAEQRAAMEEYTRRRGEYEAIRSRIFTMADAERYGEASVVLTGESLRVYQQMNAAVTDLIRISEEAAAESAAAARTTYGSARLLILISVLAAILIGIGIAGYVARIIGGPVRRLAAASKALALGDVDQVIEYDSRDELGELAVSFREMVAAQKQMAGAASAIAAGDLSVEMRARSDRDSLGRAFVELRAVIQSLVRGTNELIAAARAGELSKRGDAGAFRGGYAELMGGINDLLDAVVKPIDEAGRVLERLSTRDLTARMEGDYQGDFAAIKRTLNAAAQNLDEALSEVSMASEQVASASDQISAGSQTLAEGASEQASALEEVSSSLQEMASMTRQNAANAREARGLAEAARAGAGRGVESMRELSGAITRIKESSDATARIVKTIDEIAFQTNLLALNAAVEAARAGDAGRGFAVVAEEVRNLAMRSAQAARNTSDLIEEAVRNADGGVALNTDVLAKLEEIDAGVNRVGEVMAEIAAASEQQTQGVDQITVAVDEMNRVTQSTAANSEESASAAEELSGQADRMHELVAGFRLSRSAERKTARQGPRSGVETMRRAPAASAQAKLPAPAGAQVKPASAKKRPVTAAVANGQGVSRLKTNGSHASPAALIPLDDDDLSALSEF